MCYRKTDFARAFRLRRSEESLAGCRSVDQQRRSTETRRLRVRLMCACACASRRVYTTIVYGRSVCWCVRDATVSVCVSARARRVRFDPHDWIRLVRGGVSAATIARLGGGRAPCSHRLHPSAAPPPLRAQPGGRSFTSATAAAAADGSLSLWRWGEGTSLLRSGGGGFYAPSHSLSPSPRHRIAIPHRLFLPHRPSLTHSHTYTHPISPYLSRRPNRVRDRPKDMYARRVKFFHVDRVYHRFVCKKKNGVVAV